MKKQKTRFLDIYHSFSEIEKKEFREFASIPLFGNNRNYRELLDNLKPGENGLSNENNFLKDRTLSNRLSELTSLSQKFLVMKNLETNKHTFEIQLLEELQKRNIDNLYEKKFNAILETTVKKPLSRDKISELYEIRKLDLKKAKALNDRKRIIELHRNSVSFRLIQSFIEIYDQVIQEFFYTSGFTPDSNRNRKDVIKFLNSDLILEFINKHLNEYYPLVSFYHFFYKAVLNTDDTYNYYIARKILFNELKKIPREFKSELYGYLINYNVIKTNRSGMVGSKEIFYLVNAKLKAGMLEEELKRDSNNYGFLQFVMNALSLKKYRWTEAFIERFGKILPEQNRDNGISLCRAFLEYYKENFKACKEYADKVKKINPYYYVNASKLNLQSCFELNKFEECYPELRRLQEYMRIQSSKNELLVMHAREFCTGFVLLLRLRDKPIKRNLLKLEYELSHGVINSRNWIKRKMLEIKIKD